VNERLPMNEDLIIEITIKHKGKSYPAYYSLKKNEQTWDRLVGLTGHLGASIRLTLQRKNIIIHPSNNSSTK
jgi:hypothetical protein